MDTSNRIEECGEETTREREAAFPLEWRQWDEGDTAVLQFYDAVWLDDFGVFKAGSRYDCLTVNHAVATVTVFDDAGDPVLVQKFKAVPVQE